MKTFLTLLVLLFSSSFTNSCSPTIPDTLNPNNKLKIFDSDEGLFSIETCEDDIFCTED